MDTDLRPPRVLVARLGAMNHYLTPVSLARRGMLERFYTDIYLGSQRVRRWAHWAARCGWSGALRRLSARSAPDLPDEQVTSFPRFGLEYWWRCRRAATWDEQLDAYRWAGKRFGQLVLRHDQSAANVVYAYSSAALELLLAARQRGRLAVLDHITAPLLAERRLVAEQHERYPGWAEPWPASDSARRYAERQRAECQAADLVVCLSGFARQVLVEEGVPAQSICVVPPGLPAAPAEAAHQRAPGQPLRVLFVGNDSLRKGLPDLVRAAALLGNRRFQFRAAGASDLTPFGRAETRRTVEMLGPVPRNEMPRHFAWADVLAFPSVSETFGLVILEAMRAAAVVVTTPHGGGPDVIRDGVDGFLVPPRSPEALAEKLELLAAAPSLCQAMSAAALRRAGEFTLERCADRLAEVLSRALAERARSA